jgi:transketolase
MAVFRPGDANEVAMAWRVALEAPRNPAVLALSRQPMPTLDRTKYASAEGVRRGAYVLADPPEGEPQVILMSTGTEMALVVEAHETLTSEGIRSRVVSMPCWDLFEEQDEEYRESVLPSGLTARVAVEQAAAFGWDRYVGLEGTILGMHSFGASAPMKEVQKKFGFSAEAVTKAARKQVSQA